MKETAGLGDVARLAHVSPGTVSRVFNNSAAIPPETKMRVFAAARKLKMRPRVGIRSTQIALITEPPAKTLMGGYVNTMTQYICFALSRAGAGISLITENEIERLANTWFDGIIGIAWEKRTISILENLSDVPIVWLSDIRKKRFHSVYSDFTGSGRMAGEYLTGLGHRRTAVIHDNDYAGKLRLKGLESVLLEHGIDTEENLFAYPNDLPLSLSVKQLLNADCTAVWVTGEDMKVLEVSWLIQELAGKGIPEDISLIGFENPGVSAFLRPSLTTIASPLKEIAEKAVELVLRGPEAPLEQIVFPVRLIERNSAAAPRQTKGKK